MLDVSLAAAAKIPTEDACSRSDRRRGMRPANRAARDGDDRNRRFAARRDRGDPRTRGRSRNAPPILCHQRGSSSGYASCSACRCGCMPLRAVARSDRGYRATYRRTRFHHRRKRLCAKPHVLVRQARAFDGGSSRASLDRSRRLSELGQDVLQKLVERSRQCYPCRRGPAQRLHRPTLGKREARLRISILHCEGV